MNNLSGNDLESLSAAILSLHTQKGVEEFPTAVLKVVQALLPCEHCSYNEIDRLTKAVRVIIEPHVAEMFTMFPVFQAHFAEHPYWKYHNGTTAKQVHKTTDFMSLRRLGVETRNAVSRRALDFKGLV